MATTDQESSKLAFTEPGEDEPAGYHVYKRQKSPYERYMDEEGIPIFRGIGVRDTRELPLGEWRRRGGRGTFLYLNGAENIKGMYLVEVPAGGALNAEKHFFDEFYLVIEGRGSTEVSAGDGARPQVFEWQPGSLFMIPLNATYRLVNATGSPALLLASNNAPPIINIFQHRSIVFDNPFVPSARFTSGATDFFKAHDEVEADPVRGRAAIRSNVFPDIAHCALPLDNQRAKGFRRIQPYFHGFIPEAGMGGFVGEYPSGRYSKAHYHASGAVLVCLTGKGYTFNWPVGVGQRPWEAGHGEAVKVLDYVPGGLVAAAPGGGQWFHQHFSVGREPLRVLNFWGGPNGSWGHEDDQEKEEIPAWNIYGIEHGGRSINYRNEDPEVRRYYFARLAEEGVAPDMPESMFQ
jgi:mannose-6-phosphate isomerase-like protein (cupin superfamily)